MESLMDRANVFMSKEELKLYPLQFEFITVGNRARELLSY